MTVKIVQGDALDILKQIKPACLDACITDPPYHLTANKKGGSGVTSINLDSPYGRSRIGTGNGAGGFMGQQWDGGDVAFRTETWREVYRVLKPGAHLLAFGGTRTYHRMACAIEGAGFEIRDCLMWVYGSGFPKSHNSSKAIDRAAGAEREVVGKRQFADGTFARTTAGVSHEVFGEFQGAPVITAPATADAAQWEGWGTALKPACEPIVLARKPLSEPTIAANVLKWRTGALNIDACRITTGENLNGGAYAVKGNRTPMNGDERDGAALGMFQSGKTVGADFKQPTGRWPANVIHDGSEEVIACFPDQTSGGTPPSRPRDKTRNVYSSFDGQENPKGIGSTSVNASRFFYCAKASTKERRGFAHPTVKPLALMQYLIRLVTPPNGVVLDPFAGTGTTGEAASFENRHAILIELNQSYVEMAQRRCGLIQSQPHLQAAAE